MPINYLLKPYKWSCKTKLMIQLKTSAIRIVLMLTMLLATQVLMAQQSNQQNQRFVDERLANELYRSQEWEQAKNLYLKLYDTYKAQHYYNYYFNCLIQLRELDEAERAAKKMQRQQKNTQSDIDLGFVLQLKGESKKARDIFYGIIQQLPADRNIISTTANAFRTRNLDEFALLTYEKGSKMNGINYGFYLEKAGLYQMTGNFDATLDNYLLHLNQQPDHIDLVKSRIQSMMMMDIDNSMSELVRSKLLSKAQKEPENYIYNELLIWFSLQEKDYELAMIQAKALDRRFGERDFNIVELAHISLSNGQYEVANDGFTYVMHKGPSEPFYFEALKGALKSRYYIAEQQVATSISVYQKLNSDITAAFEEAGFNRETYELAIIQASILTYQLDLPLEARSIMERALMLPLRPEEQANLKMHIADILLFQNEVWEATLLYSQVDKSMKNEPVAHEARFRNARLRYFIGEFGWAQAQLDVLKAATSKLIANDALTLSLLINDNLTDDTTGLSLKAYAKADLLTYQKKDTAALNLLDSLLQHNRSLVLKPHVFLKKAAILQRMKQFMDADSLYHQLYLQFPDSYLSDDALFQSALLNETHLKNTDLARKQFEIIFNQYPASIYAVQARQKYRNLRGDSN
jgi:tetratricopeptide (TPR) repeat protein